MDRPLTDTVFAAAAHTTWKASNLGPRTEVSHAGYTWTVQLPSSGEGPARITGRDGYGGTEFLDVTASAVQTIPLVDAAQAAMRPGASAPASDGYPTWTLQRWDWETDEWATKSTYTTSRGEGNAYFAVRLERASSTGPIRLLKDGRPVLEDDPAIYYTQAD